MAKHRNDNAQLSPSPQIPQILKSHNYPNELCLKATANHWSTAYEPCMHPLRHPSFLIVRVTFACLIKKENLNSQRLQAEIYFLQKENNRIYDFIILDD